MTTRLNAVGTFAYRFGEYELDRRTLELRKSGQKIKLAPQPARVLRLLLSRPGELVPRDKIRRELWGEKTFVDFEQNLNYCLNCIRNALGDTAQSRVYVETLPRRGYRFIAQVEQQRLFEEPTLAVLPFANLNNDPTTEYFADGITDLLITELARIRAIRVISRQSILHLKGSSRKLDEIASDLGVDGIVEGTVLHEGNRIRLTAQLILTAPERHIWARSYNCEMSAVLTTQREAASAIASCIATALNPNLPELPVTTPAEPEAPPLSSEFMETFLKGIAELDKLSADGLNSSLQCFRKITAKAPDFALGLGWHASCLFLLGLLGHVPAREVYPTAKSMLLKTISLDDRLDGAHRMIAFIYWLLDWDLVAAEREFQRAIELSPSNAESRIFYAVFLCSSGRYAESIEETEYGLRLNPVSLIPNQLAAWNYLYSGYPQMAESQARRILELFPNSLHPHFVLGWSAWSQGRTEEAVALFEKAVKISREALSLSFLGHIYARLGRKKKAGLLLKELERLSSQGKASPVAFIILYAGLGDADAAFEWLETAFRLRDVPPWIFTKFPCLDPIRSDPRFAALKHHVGILNDSQL